MKLLLAAGIAISLAACGTIGDTTPYPKTAKCLNAADSRLANLNPVFPQDVERHQRERNECWWARGASKH